MTQLHYLQMDFLIDLNLVIVALSGRFFSISPECHCLGCWRMIFQNMLFLYLRFSFSRLLLKELLLLYRLHSKYYERSQIFFWKVQQQVVEVLDILIAVKVLHNVFCRHPKRCYYLLLWEIEDVMNWSQILRG